SEYSSEKFIEQHEHIKKLELLTDSDINQLIKRKSVHFKVKHKGCFEFHGICQNVFGKHGVSTLNLLK
ncbi:MAG: hypothetical protein ACK518_03205, partial [bacterium]